MLDFFHHSWDFYFQDSFYLVCIILYLVLIDHEPHEFVRGYSKCTFIWVKLHLVFVLDIEHLRQVRKVVLCTKAFHQHVINIYLRGLPYLLHEHSVHQPLVCSSCIF